MPASRYYHHDTTTTLTTGNDLFCFVDVLLDGFNVKGQQYCEIQRTIRTA